MAFQPNTVKSPFSVVNILNTGIQFYELVWQPNLYFEGL